MTKVAAIECDSPTCSSLGRRDGPDAPPGWIEVTITRAGQRQPRQRRPVLYFCAPSCITAYVASSFVENPSPSDGDDLA